MTTGTTIGEINSASTSACPGKRARHRPSAASVPSSVASTVADVPTSRLFQTDGSQNDDVKKSCVPAQAEAGQRIVKERAGRERQRHDDHDRRHQEDEHEHGQHREGRTRDPRPGVNARSLVTRSLRALRAAVQRRGAHDIRSLSRPIIRWYTAYSASVAVSSMIDSAAAIPQLTVRLA